MNSQYEIFSEWKIQNLQLNIRFEAQEMICWHCETGLYKQQNIVAHSLSYHENTRYS